MCSLVHKLNRLKDAINEAKNYQKVNLILEHYRTLNSEINKISKTFFNNLLKKVAKNDKSDKTKYEKFGMYLLRRYEEYKLMPNVPIKITYNYFRVIGYGNYQIRLLLLINNSSLYGVTSQSEYSTKNNVRVKPINIFILPKELDELEKIKNNRNMFSNKIEQLLEKRRETVVHEITHYFQIKNKEQTNFDEYNLNNELKNYKNLKLIQQFIYKLLAEEIPAVVNGAYQTYKEKGKYYSYKYDYAQIHPGAWRAPIKRKLFFNCLVSSLLSHYDKGELGKLILSNKVRFEDLINGIAPVDRFIILWIIFCFLPKHKSKFYELIKSEKGDINTFKRQINFNVDKLDNNRNKALAFLESLTNKERQNLDKFAEQYKEMFLEELENFFSINDDNDKAIKNLANWAILSHTSS